MAHLKMPLSRAILDDPAFSPDPRSHPHFPLANARSYKTLPSKSPPLPDGLPSSPSASPDSDCLASLSSATSHSHSRASPVPPPATKPKVISKPPPPLPPLPVPEIPPKPVSINTLPRRALKPVPTNIPRKARMKAFVRRLTARNNLDRIDELDETDPFGGSYHHDGPYEAISSNLAQPTVPRMHSNAAPRRNNVHHSKREVPSAYGETGLSLHLEPGQILQQNTIYASHTSSIASVPSHFHTVSIVVPDHSRRRSLPIPRTLSPSNHSSLGLPAGFQNHQSLSLHAPRERYLGDYTPDIPNSPPLHHDHDAARYAVPTEKTVFPPPRYESRLHSIRPPRSPPRTPPPPSDPTLPTKKSTENAGPALLPDSRHKSAHSLDSSQTMINGTFTQRSSSIQNKPLDPLRTRHLPKRLVMPAPLQPQPPQPQYKFPPAEPPAWQDEYPDHHTLDGAHFAGKPAMYISQEPRLLRKKSTAFPAKIPIPNHVPMSQDDAAPIVENSPMKTANEAEGTKERTRRRRLSKRKSDI